MDPLNAVPNVENESSDSPSIYRLKNPNEMPIECIKQEIDYLVSSEINIKTEIQEDESNISAIAGTSYEIHPNNNVELEFDNLENAITEDPLDVHGLTEDGEIEEHILFEYVDGTFDIKEIDEECQLKSETEHKTSGTGKSKNQKHTCHICQKTITTNLKIHLRTHTGERPFVCNICNKAFSVKHTLYRHMRSHMDEKPFSCNKCDKSFKRKHTLLDHLQTHTGDRPYICDVCEKSFRQQPALIRHRQLHTGKKPFICEVCNKTFARKSNFNRHEVSHKRKLQKLTHGIF